MSRHHTRLDRRRWLHVRRLALERAGWRSELSGKAGVLEVDHRMPIARGGDPYSLENLQVLTRGEHIAKTRKENERDDPARNRWRELVSELAT